VDAVFSSVGAVLWVRVNKALFEFAFLISQVIFPLFFTGIIWPLYWIALIFKQKKREQFSIRMRRAKRNLVDCCKKCRPIAFCFKKYNKNEKGVEMKNVFDSKNPDSSTNKSTVPNAEEEKDAILMHPGTNSGLGYSQLNKNGMLITDYAAVRAGDNYKCQKERNKVMKDLHHLKRDNYYFEKNRVVLRGEGEDSEDDDYSTLKNSNTILSRRNIRSPSELENESEDVIANIEEGEEDLTTMPTSEGPFAEPPTTFERLTKNFKHYIIFACLDQTTNMLMVLPLICFPSVLLIMLGQIVLPINMVGSVLILKKRYHKIQILGVIIILGGIIINILPTLQIMASSSNVMKNETPPMFTESYYEFAGEGYDFLYDSEDYNNSFLFGSNNRSRVQQNSTSYSEEFSLSLKISIYAMLITAKIIGALGLIYKEEVIKRNNMDVFYTTAMVSTFQILLGIPSAFLVLIPISSPGFNVPWKQFADYAYICFTIGFGMDYNSTEHKIFEGSETFFYIIDSNATVYVPSYGTGWNNSISISGLQFILPFWGFISCTTISNVFDLFIIKKTNAALNLLCNLAVLVASIFCMAWPWLAGPAYSGNLVVNDYISLIMIVFGIAIYVKAGNHRPPSDAHPSTFSDSTPFVPIPSLSSGDDNNNFNDRRSKQLVLADGSKNVESRNSTFFCCSQKEKEHEEHSQEADIIIKRKSDSEDSDRENEDNEDNSLKNELVVEKALSQSYPGLSPPCVTKYDYDSVRNTSNNLRFSGGTYRIQRKDDDSVPFSDVPLHDDNEHSKKETENHLRGQKKNINIKIDLKGKSTSKRQAHRRVQSIVSDGINDGEEIAESPIKEEKRD
jgi:hypothetical protein